MLEFFRKYQKGFFFVVAFLVIASTVFYGVGNVMNGAPEREVSEEERLAAELVEEGALLRTLMESGVAELVAEHYKDELEGEWQPKLERVQNYKPYVHPMAPAIAAENVWQRFAPQLLESLQKMRTEPTVGGLFKLYLAQELCPPELLRRILAYQASQHEGLPRDPRLQQGDFAIAGLRHPVDVLGRPFLRKLAHFVAVAAAEAKAEGVAGENAIQLCRGWFERAGPAPEPVVQLKVETLELPDEWIAFSAYVHTLAPNSAEPWPARTAEAPVDWLTQTYRVRYAAVDPEEVALTIPLRELIAWQEAHQKPTDGTADADSRRHMIQEQPERLEAALALAPIQETTLIGRTDTPPQFQTEGTQFRLVEMQPIGSPRLRSFAELKETLMAQTGVVELPFNEWIDALPTHFAAAKSWGLEAQEEQVEDTSRELDSWWRDGNRFYHALERKEVHRPAPAEQTRAAQQALARHLLTHV